MDIILLTLLQKRLVSISEEMSVVLRKTSYSPNIKERADFSCAIFDAKARLLAQAEAIPVHLGSMSFVAKPILEKYENKWKEGDAIIVNSPRSEFGGTHLPDISLLTPVFYENKLRYIVANRAHHADVGGMAPGSLPGNSTEVFQEGLIIPPVPLYKEYKENTDIMDFILENVRTPKERIGDLRAQYSALTLGANRLKDLLSTENWNFSELEETLLNYSNKGTIEILSKLPNGSAEFEDFLDYDGVLNEPVKIRCKVTINDGRVVFDFRGSSKQRKGNVNAPFSITTAACSYVIRLLIGRRVPTNEGCFRNISILTDEGSVVNPNKNAATSSANTETSSRIVDVVMGAMGQLTTLAAASQGTMNNVILGGIHNGKPWTIYETIAGGIGASKNKKGTDAIQSHMTNTLNTPIEALEMNFPLRVLEYSIRENSGGIGLNHGGNGLVRKYLLLDDATLSLQTERREIGPWGIEGGGSGVKGENILYRDGKIIKLEGRLTKNLIKGDILEIRTPGGGGYGKSISEITNK